MKSRSRKGVRFAVDNLLKRYFAPGWYVRFHARTWRLRREPELGLLRDLVQADKHSIDIGANWGVYTYILSGLCRHVYAYEPNPEIFAKLAMSAGAKVTLYKLALSDRQGAGTLYVPTIEGIEADGLSRLEKGFKEFQERRFEIELTRLDDQWHTNIGFIKIDVEGHEKQVIAGATETLTREQPTLMIEIEERHTQRHVEDVFRIIEDIGYTGYFYAIGSLRPLEEFSRNKHQHPRNFDRGSPMYIRDFIFKPRL